MKKTRLANRKNRTNAKEDIRLYKKHNNYISRLCKRETKALFNKLDIKNLKDNKTFWKSIKLLISDKTKGNHKITLVKDCEILSKDQDVAMEFTFSKAVSELEYQA